MRLQRREHVAIVRNRDLDDRHDDLTDDHVGPLEPGFRVSLPVHEDEPILEALEVLGRQALRDRVEDADDVPIAEGVAEEDDGMLDEDRQQLRCQIGVAVVEAAVVLGRQHERVRPRAAPVDLVDLADAGRLVEDQLVLPDVGLALVEERFEEQIPVRGDEAVDHDELEGVQLGDQVRVGGDRRAPRVDVPRDLDLERRARVGRNVGERWPGSPRTRPPSTTARGIAPRWQLRQPEGFRPRRPRSTRTGDP